MCNGPFGRLNCMDLSLANEMKLVTVASDIEYSRISFYFAALNWCWLNSLHVCTTGTIAYAS